MQLDPESQYFSSSFIYLFVFSQYLSILQYVVY